MRVWSLHPQYLDAKGLVALWRETLLAQAVLNNATKGYRNHPQLERFKQLQDPLSGIANYLGAVHQEASLRGYSFNATKIGVSSGDTPMQVTRGQLQYEWQHLLKKLELRCPDTFAKWAHCTTIEPHPLFTVVEGDIASWEKLS